MLEITVGRSLKEETKINKRRPQSGYSSKVKAPGTRKGIRKITTWARQWLFAAQALD
jgi:hypothetical protein